MRHPFALSSFALSALLLTMSCTNSTSTNTGQAAAGSTTEQQTTAPSTAPHATPPASAPMPQSATEAASSIPDFTFYKVKSGISYTKADIPENKRSEEHTSELQSRENLVCRLLLEKKKRKEYK